MLLIDHFVGGLDQISSQLLCKRKNTIIRG